MGGMHSPPSPPAPPPAPAGRRGADGAGSGEVQTQGQASVFQNQSEVSAQTAPRFLSGSADLLSTTTEVPGARPTPQTAGYGFGGGAGPTGRPGLRGNRKQVRRIAQPEFGTRPDTSPGTYPPKPPTRPSGGQGAPRPGGLARMEDGDDAIARQIKAITQRRKTEEAAPGATPWPKTLADALQRFRDAYAKTAGQQAAQQTPQADSMQPGFGPGGPRDGRAETGKAGLVARLPQPKPSYPPGAMILVPDSDAPGILGPFAKRQDLPNGIVLAQGAPLEEFRDGDRTDARTAAPPAGSSAKPINLISPDGLEPQDMPVHDRRRDFWIRQQFRSNGGLNVQPGTTIRENSIIYGHMDEELQTREGAIRSQWWGVAGDVTGPLGVGAADPYALNGTVLNEKDEAFLQTVSHTLAPMNFRNYQHLVQGKDIPGLEGLRGKELDYALVEMEQKAVTAIMDQYFKENPNEDRAEIVSRVTDATNTSADRWGVVRDKSWGWIDGERTARVVRDLFPNGGYDFANQDHRIAVGRALVDLKYADGEAKR